MLNYTYVVASHARRHRPKNMSYTRAEKKNMATTFSRKHMFSLSARDDESQRQDRWKSSSRRLKNKTMFSNFGLQRILNPDQKIYKSRSQHNYYSVTWT